MIANTPIMRNSFCGSSSAGRAIPCQGIGREFEPLLPLQNLRESILAFPQSFQMYGFALWRDSKMVMQRIANPPIPVRFRVSPPNACPGGEIGRHNGLKIRRG